MCALNKIADVLMYIFKVTPSIFIMYADPLSMRGTDSVGMPSMEPSHTTCLFTSQPMDKSAANHGTRSLPSALASISRTSLLGRRGAKRKIVVFLFECTIVNLVSCSISP